MTDHLKDILSHLSKDIDQETLLQYLQGTITPERKHELEKQLVDNEFASDALDGLAEIKDKQQIQYMVEMLNRDLKKKLEKKKQRREKMKIKSQPTLYIALVILFLLLILSFFVIRKMMQQP
jgi:predicted secreted protein